jgi:Family of unknown function (DUF5906)
MKPTDVAGVAHHRDDGADARNVDQLGGKVGILLHQEDQQPQAIHQAHAPEISSKASDLIASWRRVLNQTVGDRRPIFERACGELLRLAKTEPDSKQVIVDELADMAEGAAIAAADAREIFARTAQSCTVDEPPTEGVSIDDFHSYMPMHSYIFAPTRELWPGSSINGRIPPIPVGIDEKGKPKAITASCWLDQNKPIEQMTWAPGEPMLIRNRIISDGGWIPRAGVTCFNLYRPPMIELGDPAEAGPWLDHVCKVFSVPDADHITKWVAHRTQRPAEKINHGLVLGGAQGIGKDTLLEPVKWAIGPWNFSEVSPQHMLGRFNGFLRSVILRVSEARDLGDVDRFQFYDHLKSYTAAPPDVLRVDEKNLREYAVLNCVGIIITTNHKTDGIYLPADDRRHFVAWSDLTKDSFEDGYWTKLWTWYNNGGHRHVAAYLAGLDISSFNPKAPPPKTQAFWEIVDASRAPEDAELADAIDVIGKPAALTLTQIASRAGGDFGEWLRDRKNARRIPHRLEACGYVAVRNNDVKDGHWTVDGRRQVIYVKAELPLRDRINAARDLAGR